MNFGAPLLMAVLGAGAPQAAATPPSIVGHWELSRLDDVPPPEAPPAGMFNLQVVFTRKGTLTLVEPVAQEPHEGGYELQGDRFRGWLGLTNDLTGRATLSWATDERFELTYPDGSVASFRRVSAEPKVPDKPAFRCVPVTVRGVDYDRSRVAFAKRLGDRRSSVSPPRELLGEWTASRDSEGVRMSIRLTFGADGMLSRCAVRRSEYSAPSADASRASYTVQDGYLITQLFGCGDPTPYRIEKGALVLDGEMALQRPAPQNAAAGECK